MVHKKADHNFISHFGCAALAGSVAVCIINPLDVIKTKLQT
jgi:hypothetical protein